MSKKKHEEEHDNSERWLLSYADFITLLMIFFIIMYSMSNVDSEKYKQITSSLSSAFGGGSGITMIDTGGSNNSIINIENDLSPQQQEKEQQDNGSGTSNMTESQRLEQVKKNVDQYLKDTGLDSNVGTSIEARGLVLSFKDALFFDSGKASIHPEQAKNLVAIGKILNQSIINQSYIRVEGHTDNVPMKNYLYNSNWDLSVMRASNVAQLIISESGIKPNRVSVVGYGEYRPKGDNNTVEGRASNRRVDILIMNSEFNEIEDNKK